jgi:CheY-like chemotaxis protein
LQAVQTEAAEPPPPDADPSLGERVVSMSHATILFAEDDERVREVAAEMLREAGFRVLAASDGVAALALLRGGERIDLMFSDVMMPGGVDGYALAIEARRLRPGLPVLLTTGLSTASGLPEEHGFEVVAKPYDQVALIRRLREMLASGEELLAKAN